MHCCDDAGGLQWLRPSSASDGRSHSSGPVAISVGNGPFLSNVDLHVSDGKGYFADAGLRAKITVLSAMMTAFAGALYCQYQMFISPDTVSGIAVSLQMVFAVIVGGVYVSLGPTIGAIITILLAEILRISFGTKAVGWDNLVYGVLLVLFIIFLPKGILGSVIDRFKTQPKKPVEKPAEKPVAKPAAS